MRKFITMALVMIVAWVQNAWGWDGSGTSSDPYLISSEIDFTQLATSVKAGNSYSGKVFRMTCDLNVGAVSIGTDESPFGGIFDGDNHTLTYNYGKAGSAVSVRCAPFRFVSGATIRHLRTTGSIVTSEMYAGGIISMVKGSSVTTLQDCQSDMDLHGHGYAPDNAAFGGLVGAVNTGGLVIDNCFFYGQLDTNNSAGMVGWSNVNISISNSAVICTPPNLIRINNGATFARMAGGATCTVTNSYYTHQIETQGKAQGEPIFDRVVVPDGCTATIVSEPDFYFCGGKYWKSGAWVELTVPEGTAFDHWYTQADGCHVSDPWTANGRHQLKDIRYTPNLFIATSMPEARLEREMDGTKYRYLTANDYHLYLSDEDCEARNYTFEGTKSSDYLIKKVDGSTCYITAVVGWVPGEIPSDGAQIHNDLSGVFHDYSLVGCIAPHAFEGCTELKTLYFKDTDANNYNAQEDFHFLIGEKAFANCPNFTEMKMMQYTTKGDNTWQMIKPDQVSFVAPDAFDGSKNLKVSCHREVYQDYLSSEVWKEYIDRIMVYDATVEDFCIDGVKYHQYRNKTEDELLTNANQDVMLDNHVRIWNADYQNFNAADLLKTKDKATVYYTSVVGVDDDDIDDNDGKMVILNDLGTYYNYKTICLGRNAIAGNEHVKSIEFRQVNGDQTSRSDLKMVIQNNAFKGCKNLKELRMFYFCEDGDDHYEVLGPENVIPGNNIFGLPKGDAALEQTQEEKEAEAKMLANFRILVSPSKYNDFLEDPNWTPYIPYIVVSDNLPTNAANDFTIGGEDGLIYNYILDEGGIHQTSQTVSQDVSWWTAPRIIVEVALNVLMWCTGSAATVTIDEELAEQASGIVEGAISKASPYITELNTLQSNKSVFDRLLQAFRNGLWDLNGKDMAEQIAGRNIFDMGFNVDDASNVVLEDWNSLVEKGLVDPKTGVFASADVILPHADFDFMNQCTSLLCVVKENMGARTAYLKSKIADILTTNAEGLNKLCSKLWWDTDVSTPEGLNGLLAEYLGTLTHTGTKWAFNTQAAGYFAGVNAAGVLSSYVWGETNPYGGDALRKGMRENIMSNIHQVGMTGGGYIISTPQKNLVYHTFLKEVKDNVTDAVIYAGTDKGQGKNASARTMTFAKRAFQNKKNLKTVSFHENTVTTNEALPMLLTIPDSAFVGCDNLEELNLILETDGNGQRALGPENFILAGDSIFAGLDPAKFHIKIDKSRKYDFLFNASWAPLEPYFVYGEAKAKTQHTLYGVEYAYAYDNASVQKVHKESGHKIEHTFVNGVEDSWLENNSGTASLYNDIGEWNNYQLDYVATNAFKGNDLLRRVQFADLVDYGPFGECYTGLNVTLQDSCFANCGNLQTVDLIYCVNDQPSFVSQVLSGKLESNHIVPMTPDMIKIGSGVFFNSPGMLKMMPKQVSWFEADSTWSKYKNKFMPCIISPVDPAVRSVLSPYRYRFDEGPKGWYYEDIDLSYLPYRGYGEYDISPLEGEFPKKKDDLCSFAEFKAFETIGIKDIPDGFFEGCYKLNSILLPSTIERIGQRAFKGCSSLKEIILPENVFYIQEEAFAGTTSLNTIRIQHKGTVADIKGSPFHEHNGLKIVVPDDLVSQYKSDSDWEHYAPYIIGESEMPINKVITVTAPGQLADKLGLSVRKSSGKVRYIDGLYAKYDSLTISGPLNGDDLGVIRYLAGADAYDSDPTDGQLRYLDLWNAELKKDTENSYNGNGSDEYTDADNKVGDYLFENCTALETVILPKSATYIGENIFEDASNLKRVCVGFNTTQYECDIFQSLSGVQELALITDQQAKTDYSDAWEAPINVVYTTNSSIGGYMGEQGIITRTQNILVPFAEDAAIKALADNGCYFPTDYLQREDVEGIFQGNDEIRHFDDFWRFGNVKNLDRTFYNTINLRSITLPTSIESIGRDAFAACPYLKTINISCDSVPELAEDAFRDLVPNFEINVPKKLCKLYRTKWPQYADHINVEKIDYAATDIITVTLTEPNTLAEALGLSKVTYRDRVLKYLRGDFSKIRKLKVVGPISGIDFDVMKYLCGYMPWNGDFNYLGKLEYIDLYDANIVESTETQGIASGYQLHQKESFVVKNNQVPHQAFLKAYSLKTLILPKTAKVVQSRAMQECEYLETLVLGDDLEEFDWNALDDDASLTRMYLLGKKKMDISSFITTSLWNSLCNNYNPTFDAFYVRPSLVEAYRDDPNFTSSSWQRTNNIQSGLFTDDDDSFCCFAAHAAATADDLSTMYSVDGWFKNHPEVKDLTPLRYTSVMKLNKEDFDPLSKLEKITMPLSLDSIDDGIFENNLRLDYVDMMLCDNVVVNTDMIGDVKGKLGICAPALVYVPSFYGETDEHNVVWENGATLRNKYYDLYDGRDYAVPYPFTTQHVTNSRNLAKRAGQESSKYTVCLPYSTSAPDGAKTYRLTKREGSTLVFDQVYAIKPFIPYLVVSTANKVTLNDDNEQEIPSATDAVAGVGRQQIDVAGYTMRGNLSEIDNYTAAQMGTWILQEDNLWHKTKSGKGYEEATIPAFRTYLLENGGYGINTFSMELTDESDGVDTILTIDSDGTERYYDLNGRLLPGKPQRGAYIHNGRKYVK